MKIEDMELGQEIWFSDAWDNILSGKIIRFYDDHSGYVGIKGTRGNPGTQGVKINGCYPSRQELLDAMEAESERRRKKFCEEIRTTGDLARFMYSHAVSCTGEWTDWDARRAAAERAKDLLHIDLDEDAAG